MGISSTALHLLSKIYFKKNTINLDTVCELGAQELNLKERYFYYSKFPFDNLNIENYLSVEESTLKGTESRRYTKKYLLIITHA